MRDSVSKCPLATKSLPRGLFKQDVYVGLRRVSAALFGNDSEVEFSAGRDFYEGLWSSFFRLPKRFID